jgi:hypothetical protein
VRGTNGTSSFSQVIEVASPRGTLCEAPLLFGAAHDKLTSYNRAAREEQADARVGRSESRKL